MNAIEFLSQNVVSIIALLVSCVTFYLTNRTNKKVNSKEFEITENIKYEYLHLIAVLRALDAKALLAPFTDVDYKPEIEAIEKIKMNPSFLYILYSVTNKDDRYWLQFDANMIVTSGHSLPQKNLREFINRMLRILKTYVNYDAVSGVELKKMIPAFCDVEGLVSNDNDKKEKETETDTKDDKFVRFIDHLVSINTNDPDVDLYYGYLHNDQELLEKAIDRGANVTIKAIDLINKYKKEYDSLS